jgi:hypothetical protein
MTTEYKAGWEDRYGQRSKYLFARHKETGHRISARRFYGLPGEHDYEREGYVLMTTRRPNDEPKPGLFDA